MIIICENLLDVPETSLSLTHQVNHEFDAQFIIEASIGNLQSKT